MYRPDATDLTVSKAKKIIKRIEDVRKSPLLVLVSSHMLDDRVAFELNNILRSIGKINSVDVLLESKGGNIDMAYKILTLLESYVGQVTVVVPFFAKSAATLISLGADKLILCKAGELGPIDPQVVDPQTGAYVPAHSIKEAMSFIEEVEDGLIRGTLSEKIPILLIGAYRGAEKSSRQYLDEILDRKSFDENKKNELLDLFTKRYFSHGYPMNRKFLTQNGIKVDEIDEKTEALFADLHMIWQQYLYSMDSRNAEDVLILQTKDTEHIYTPNVYQKTPDTPETDASERPQSKTDDAD